MAFASFILYAFLLLQFSIGSHGLEMNMIKPEDDQPRHPSPDLSLNVFFKITDLYLGNKIQIYLASKKDSTPTQLLSKEEADSIPFSLSKLPHLLEYFSFSNTSSQAKAMQTTLKQCEVKPIGGEVKTCVTSLKSMMEMTRHFFGMVKPKVLTTKILSSKHTLYQNYTIVEKPKEVNTSKVIACHTMAYPYMVYYCHGHKGHMTRLFKVALGGDNKERINAIAVCHMDTSKWDRDHVSFRILGVRRGSSPVCHVIPVDNFVWFA
ncbi:hypothetical protein QVD17_14462 [Tagetes erecta]|uniref:BURP domain-containing protein n=1 Tax=Tagetes erecta TaxID=13708 RepID=A0AAD8P2N3_TARER|nr:hypothetical protein QVD17_14462 [Tagetes erecta]